MVPARLAIVIVVSFPAGPFQANCYVLAAEPGGPALVVDPGMDAAARLDEALATQDLTVGAVALTHGHIDHCGDAARVGRDHDVPVWCPTEDRLLLSDPMAALGEFARPLVEQWYGSTTLAEPDEVVEVAPDTVEDLAGLRVEFLHAPGHTPGSSMLRFHDPVHGPIVLSGDVVFAGSVGRVDMPRADARAMQRTLAGVVAGLDDATHLLPGHGPATTMAREWATNPFLVAG